MASATFANRAEARPFSQWHEHSIEDLLIRSGLDVQREPLIDGKTPDILVTDQRGDHLIIECMARMQDPDHAMELALTGCHHCDDALPDIHRNLRSRLDEKTTKYRHIADRMPYVIALYDATCTYGLELALDLVLSSYAPTHRKTGDGKISGKIYNTLWPQSVPVALFERYPHLTGLIYSTWPRTHHYLPNPCADHLVPDNLFPFASIPRLPFRYRYAGWHHQPATIEDRSPEPPHPWDTRTATLSAHLASQRRAPEIDVFFPGAHHLDHPQTTVETIHR